MKTFVVVGSLVALVLGVAAAQEKQGGKKQQEGKGVMVLHPTQADWKQAEKMPQGVMMYKAAECKCGGAVMMLKIPAGTKVPPHMTEVDKVIHVHEGKIEIGEAGQAIEGRGQSVTSGGLVKISAGSSFWMIASEDTLILAAKDGCAQKSNRESP